MPTWLGLVLTLGVLLLLGGLRRWRCARCAAEDRAASAHAGQLAQRRARILERISDEALRARLAAAPDAAALELALAAAETAQAALPGPLAADLRDVQARIDGARAFATALAARR